jgi:TonB-dependent starch-binding outer membrane protein SusC
MMKSLLLNILILIFPFTFQILVGQDPATHDSLKSMVVDEFLTGYNTQKLKRITGSVGYVQHQKLITIPAGNVINQMQGLVPGLTVIGSGQPGETSKSFIRGPGTFGANTPLFIVDGVPFDDLSLLNPGDVESVAVLKDASSAAIYGSRSLNGVMVIRTKSGRQGLQVRYNTSAGFQFPGKGTADELLSSQELADLQWLVYENDNSYEIHPLYGASTNPDPTLPSWAANTDWYDAVTDRSVLQNHDLSLSGGTKNARFYLGGGYFDQDGIIMNTNTKRYSLRLNSEIRLLKDRLKIGENIHVTKRSGNYVPNLSEIIMGIYRLPSIIPVYISENYAGLTRYFHPGEFGGAGMAPRLGNSINIVADRIRNIDDIKTDHQLAGNVFADLMIINGLQWKTFAGGTKGSSDISDYTYATYENVVNISTPSKRDVFSSSGSWIISSFIELDKTFRKHNISSLTGYERVNTGEGRYENINRTVESPEVILGRTEYRYKYPMLSSVFAKAGYSFDERYLFDAVIRFEGHNVYPAVAAGWRISGEPFMKNLVWLSDLIFRASYGKTGVMKFSREYAMTTNLGLDSRLLNNQLGFTIDWFIKNSKSHIPVELPGSTGYGLPNSHIKADMKNSGVDAIIDYNWSFGDLHVHAGIILTAYRNTIGKSLLYYFDEGFTRIGSTVRNAPGHPVSSFFGYQVTGLYRDAEEIASAPVQDGAEPGFFRYANLNSDNAIDPDDRTFLGNPHPRFTAGFDPGISYKNFDITALLFLSQGNQVFNFNKWHTDFWPSFQGQKSKRLLYDSWTESNRDASVPKASQWSGFSTNAVSNSYYVEDGSYLRMKSLQIGYSFNDRLISKARLSFFRIYLQAVNLFTFTKYSGLDPEIGGNSVFGIDYGNYPNARQLLIGINLGIN